MLLESAQLCLLVLGFTEILVWGKIFQFELHPSSTTPYARKLISANRTGFEKLKNGVYSAVPDMDDPAHANNRGLSEFHALRHLSRYEQAFRTRHDIDHQRHWDGVYDFDIQNETQYLQSSRSLYYLGHQTDSYQSVPLSQGYGTHYANVWVGSPVPQRKTVIVDTGSHYTAFPCKGCRNCGEPHHTDPYFDTKKSETFHQLQCDECRDGVVCEDGQCLFTQSYTEGSSWEAIQVKDKIYCGGQDIIDAVEPRDKKYSIDFMFGCQKSVKGLFITQLADGIMGLSAHQATIPKQLYDRRITENNLFAICYRRERGTSRRGVMAGSMTIGGYSTKLDTSPMVFAKNVARIGWYTVYVKNIFIRKEVGIAPNEQSSRNVIKVKFDRGKLNSGKGVIVDSGTTDTYLNKAAAYEFNRAWRQATGRSYSHLPIRLTKEEMEQLPTILIQCLGYSSSRFPGARDIAQAGYAGKLDPTSPTDLLIAIPATNYMDYSPVTKMYTSRLYFTESAGGVLGSNTMQGHNVVFDWGNGRIGFAESPCSYDFRNVPEAAIDDGISEECELSEPILSQPCRESVDARICDDNPSNIALIGKERWSGVVKSAGIGKGNTCQENTSIDSKEGLRMSCLGTGVCEEVRECQLTCRELRVAMNVTKSLTNDPATADCGDSLWSACDFACVQSRIVSEAYTDGKCHEVSREKRPCHIGACVRRNPCRVPFMIHVVIAFRGADVSRWSKLTEASLGEALSSAASLSHPSAPAFLAGDVNFLAAVPWHESGDDVDQDGHYYRSPAGVKVSFEVAVFNALADGTKGPPVSSSVVDDENAWSHNLTDLTDGSSVQCNPEQLHDTALRASSMKEMILNSRLFFDTVLDQLETFERANNIYFPLYKSPFEPVFWSEERKNQSEVLSVWTVLSVVDDEINLSGPPRPLWQRLLLLAQMTMIALVLFSILLNIWLYFMDLFDRLSIQLRGRPSPDLAFPRSLKEHLDEESVGLVSRGQGSSIKRRGTLYV